MQTKELVKLIDRTIVDIWENEIKSDYECGWLLKEDTLKNDCTFICAASLGKYLKTMMSVFSQDSRTINSRARAAVRI